MGNFKIENYWENQLKNLNVNEFEQNKNFIQSLQNFLSNDSFHSRVFSKSTPENITTKLTESYVRACTLMSTIPEFVGLTTTEQEKVKTALTLEWYYYGYAIGKTKVDQTIKVLLDGGTMDQALQNSPNVYAFYSTWSNQKLEEHATEIKQELSATPAYIDNTQKKDSTNSTESISPEFVAEQLFHAPEEDGTLYHATNGNSNISQERPSSLNQEWVASPDTIKPKITEEDLPQLYWTEAPKETPEPKQKTETLYLLNSVTNTRHFELMLFDIKSSREYNRGEVSINYDSNGWLHIHVPQPPTRKGDANLTVYDYIIDQKTLNSFGAQKLLENLSELETVLGYSLDSAFINKIKSHLPFPQTQTAGPSAASATLSPTNILKQNILSDKNIDEVYRVMYLQDRISASGKKSTEIFYNDQGYPVLRLSYSPGAAINSTREFTINDETISSLSNEEITKLFNILKGRLPETERQKLISNVRQITARKKTTDVHQRLYDFETALGYAQDAIESGIFPFNFNQETHTLTITDLNGINHVFDFEDIKMFAGLDVMRKENLKDTLDSFHDYLRYWSSTTLNIEECERALVDFERFLGYTPPLYIGQQQVVKQTEKIPATSTTKKFQPDEFLGERPKVEIGEVPPPPPPEGYRVPPPPPRPDTTQQKPLQNVKETDTLEGIEPETQDLIPTKNFNADEFVKNLWASKNNFSINYDGQNNMLQIGLKVKNNEYEYILSSDNLKDVEFHRVLDNILDFTNGFVTGGLIDRSSYLTLQSQINQIRKETMLKKATM